MKKLFCSIVALTLFVGPALTTAFACEEGESTPVSIAAPIHKTGAETPGTLAIINNENFLTAYKIIDSNKNEYKGTIAIDGTATLNFRTILNLFPNGGTLIIYKVVDKKPYPQKAYEWSLTREMLKSGGHLFTQDAYMPID